ncbi:MAG: hypothetical protein IPG23_23075 [Burkholderiales bacterium]|nr:hypothetical protein [Burkholderiales bacterium]
MSPPPVATGAAAAGGPNYPYLMNRQPRQKSFAELANEQLNPGGRKDKFVAAMEGAQMPDCLGTNQTGQVAQGQVNFNGLFAAPAIAAQALQGKCK